MQKIFYNGDMTNKRYAIFTAIIPFVFILISLLFFSLSILFTKNNWNPLFIDFFYMSSTVIYSFCWLIADITSILSMGLSLALIKNYKVKALPEILFSIIALCASFAWTILFFRPFFIQ